jgi:hypothetical protein
MEARISASTSVVCLGLTNLAENDPARTMSQCRFEQVIGCDGVPVRAGL